MEVVVESFGVMVRLFLEWIEVVDRWSGRM